MGGGVWVALSRRAEQASLRGLGGPTHHVAGALLLIQTTRLCLALTLPLLGARVEMDRLLLRGRPAARYSTGVFCPVLAAEPL